MKLSEIKRRQIILASVKEFRENGFSGTSMDKVAQRADVSKRTVYNHFESKDALFFGIVEHMFSLIASSKPRPYETGACLSEQLTAIAQSKISLFSSDEFIDLSRVALPEAILHPEKMQTAMAQFSQLDTSLEHWFEQAIGDGKLNIDNANLACEKFMGLVKMDAYWPRIFKAKTIDDKGIQVAAEKTTKMFLACYGV